MIGFVRKCLMCFLALLLLKSQHFLLRFVETNLGVDQLNVGFCLSVAMAFLAVMFYFDLLRKDPHFVDQNLNLEDAAYLKKKQAQFNQKKKILSSLRDQKRCWVFSRSEEQLTINDRKLMNSFVHMSYFEIQQELESIYVSNENQESYCFRCETTRPSRSHHCKYCNKCVLRLNHHCFLVGKCIGKNNLGDFIMMVFYATLSVTLMAVQNLFSLIHYNDIYS